MYVFLDENSNKILQRLILDDDKIPEAVIMNYNGSFRKTRACTIVNIFLKKEIFIIFRFASGSRLCELRKTKRTRAHIDKH